MDEILKEKLALGRFHYVRREFARAEQYLTQVVEGNPTFADVYNMLGVCFHDQGHYQKAQRAFEAALRLNPAYTDAALNLAITYNDTGRYKEAQEAYQQALSTSGAAPGQLDHFVRGKLANMYADIGDVYLSSGLYPEAIAELRRALALCPAFVDIRARLAAALRDSGRRDEAIVEYEEVVRQNAYLHPGAAQPGALALRRRPQGRGRRPVERGPARLPRQPQRRALSQVRRHRPIGRVAGRASQRRRG